MLPSAHFALGPRFDIPKATAAMSIPERYKALAESYKDEASVFFAELEKGEFPPLTEQKKEELWEQGLWRLVLMRAGESLPMPDGITMELVASIPPSELASYLWDYLCVVTDEAGCHRSGHYRETITGLPRGLRIVHTLSILDGEIFNGGFPQFFTNSSGGELTDETLEDLQYIGAARHAAILEEAIALNRTLEAKYPFYKNRFQVPAPRGNEESEAAFWSEMESVYEPEFDRVSSEFYERDDYKSFRAESLWQAFERYAQQHPEEFVHSRVER
ncbi:MAG: DUF4375 domain-containing protein [Planctomycetaceae bacterium]|nr:DUF4375 domain-containing protein [Planctomycetaceae bacterium]